MARRRDQIPFQHHGPWQKDPPVETRDPDHTARLFRELFPTGEPNNLTSAQWAQLRDNNPMLQRTQPAPGSQFADWNFLHNTDPTAPNLRTRYPIDTGPPTLRPRLGEPQGASGTLEPADEPHQQAPAESVTSGSSGSSRSFFSAAESLSGHSDYHDPPDEPLAVDRGGLRSLLQQVPTAAQGGFGGHLQQGRAVTSDSPGSSSGSMDTRCNGGLGFINEADRDQASP